MPNRSPVTPSERSQARRFIIKSHFGSARAARSRKNRPCDVCRRRKTACVIPEQPPCESIYNQTLYEIPQSGECSQESQSIYPHTRQVSSASLEASTAHHLRVVNQSPGVVPRSPMTSRLVVLLLRHCHRQRRERLNSRQLSDEQLL